MNVKKTKSSKKIVLKITMSMTVNGLLRWPDGSRIYCSGNETWVQAVTRNTPVEVNFAEVVTFEPSLETACNYVGIEREEGDASTDEQEEALG